AKLAEERKGLFTDVRNPKTRIIDKKCTDPDRVAAIDKEAGELKADEAQAKADLEKLDAESPPDTGDGAEQPDAPKTQGVAWGTSYAGSLDVAKSNGKLVLADFSGSDWSPGCKRLQTEVFGTKEFGDWATKNVVLLQVDFPKRAQQSDDLRKQNEQLKQTFGISGVPTVLFLDGEGNKIGQVTYGGDGVSAWIASAQSVVDSKGKK
ncbi:thioredoxin family protein, partial [bacterium]|nr:thioredoxin family protein [bacterium]